MFETILITGHGELARRVERTCNRIGVDLATNDEFRDSKWQLDPAVVLAAAQRTGAGAVHPGYVAPRSRAAVAKLVREHAVAFVGPSTSALEAMADKAILREHALDAGLSVVRGSAAISTLAEAVSAAAEVGYPVMIKPTSGTAAIGLHTADDDDELEEAFTASMKAATETFEDPRVVVEHLLRAPRLLEVTIVADGHGNVRAFGERECSIQDNGRALIAESPSPVFQLARDGDALREDLSEATCRLARNIGLEGIATFEFLCDETGGVHFLEGNSDMLGAVLVTEMLTGIDPIELQLDIAGGNPLGPVTRLRTSGHSFEARVLATTDKDPSVSEMRFPPAPQGKVRIEPAVDVGEQPYECDSLIARVATCAPIRHLALLALDRTLAETHIDPVPTNIEFLRKVLNHESFRAGQYDTGFARRLR